MDALIALLKADANAANAFGALASAAVAFLALFISVVSVGISVWAVRSERRHNELSARPLAEVTVADYESILQVKLRNHGIGPMIVSAVTVSDGSSTRSSLIDWMPDLPSGRTWSNFAADARGRSLAPGGEVEYTNVYNTAMPPHRKSLSWFGRPPDDPMLLKSLQETLQEDGHVVVVANGGQAGIDAFQAASSGNQQFSVVITDLGMPYIDGRKVAAAIKATSPRTPVILLTGWGQRLVNDGDLPQGIDRVLSKPPRLRELRLALLACGQS